MLLSAAHSLGQSLHSILFTSFALIIVSHTIDFFHSTGYTFYIIAPKGGITVLFTADIGNTSISVGVYKDASLAFTSRIFTDKSKSADGYALALNDIINCSGLSQQTFSGAIISSVVPEVTDNFSLAVKMLTGKKPLTVGEEYNGGLKIEILPVSHLGADLIAASIGAISKYPLPCLIADLGTATKIIVIDKDGVFRGCTISPGVKISLDALSQNASLLPEISLTKPERAIGENTVACMQSGIVFGTAGMLDGLIKRICRELDTEKATVIATGGYSKAISECCETEMLYDENLILDGLKVIYEKATD